MRRIQTHKRHRLSMYRFLQLSAVDLITMAKPFDWYAARIAERVADLPGLVWTSRRELP